MTRRVALAAWAVAACAYYNAMWSAEHLAKAARKLEREDRSGEARSYWAQAAVKAESVVARHPRSRWADDALVLQGEALTRSGGCSQAGDVLRRALETVEDEALRERAELAAAECALDRGDPVAASHALAEVTQSRDGRRRSRAALLTGRAAMLAGDPGGAAEWLGRSDAPDAVPPRVRALLAAGRSDAALALTDMVARIRFREAEWRALLDDLGRAAGPETTSAVLDRMLARRRPPAGARARLLLADGDALLAAGRADAASARYAQVAALVPDSSEGELARLRAIRVLAARAESLPQLALVEAQLGRIQQSGTSGAVAGETRALMELVAQVRQYDDLPETGRFRLAELVRDSLGAPRIAGRLFQAFAQRAPGSLFAPKALLAAAALVPERRDSLIAVLDSRYAGSPYTRALRGEQSPAFGAAEDSLARALGIALGAPRALLASRVAPPVPGPRGPSLDPPASAPAAAPVRDEPRPARRPVRAVEDDDRAPRRESPAPITPRDSL